MSNTRVVFDKYDDDEDFPPSNIMEFSGWLAEKVSEIPIEYRNSAEMLMLAALGQREDDQIASVRLVIQYQVR